MILKKEISVFLVHT